MIGRVLDSFRIVSLLGRGGMGEVWKAEQVSLGGRPVALKLLRADRADAARAVERLVREGVLAASLRHPGIAQVYSAGEADGLHYVAMEFVEGESLASRLARGPLEPEEARRVTLAVAEALAFAHERGVLHRDVTPGNIVLEAGGRVVLLDFGLALAMGQSRLTSEDAVVGTVHFVAPEVLRGFEADARSDVYGLGVVFYHALAGVLPYAGGRREQVEHAMLNDAAEAPSKIRPALLPAWDQVALRAIAREPGLRFASAREFARALESLGTGAAGARAGSASTTAEVPGPAWPGGGRVLRIAVIPFADIAGTQESSALADGFSDSVGASLSRHPQIKVVPAMSTRDLAKEGVRRVAREFGVDHVLSGTVHRNGDRLRVTFALVDSRSAEQVVADVIEKPLRDLDAIEGSLVRTIATALKLAPVAARPSTGQGTDHLADEHVLQARGYLQRSDDEASVDRAIHLLEPLTNRDGADAGMWATLASAYRRKYGRTLDRSWLDRAQHAAAMARSLDPGSAEALAESGLLHVMFGRHGEAEAEFMTARDLRPDLVSPRIGLVALLKNQGRIEAAESECRSAIAIRPDAWGLFNQLGAILFERGRYDEAIECFEQVVRLMPNNTRAPANIAAAYFRLGRLQEAERAYRAALELHRSPAALTGLGTVLFYQDDLKGAVEAFERATSLSDNDPVMWGNLGAALRWDPDASARAREAFDRAVALVRDRLAINPRDAVAMANLATWLVSCGDLAAAREWMERALATDPGSAQVQAQAVTVFEVCGDRGAALKAMETAIAANYGWMEFEHNRDLARLRATADYRALRTANPGPGSAGAASAERIPRPEEDA